MCVRSSRSSLMAALRLLKLTRAVTPLMPRAVAPSMSATQSSRTPMLSMPIVRCFSSEDDIEERIKEIIIKQLDVEDAMVEAGASLVDDLGADSLDTVELVMTIEEEFNMEIPDEEAEKIITVQALIDYVASQ